MLAKKVAIITDSELKNISEGIFRPLQKSEMKFFA